MRATVLEMMIFVRFTVLREATVFVETSVIVEATSLERMCIGATVLYATVLVGATVLGGRYRKCG
jgi:hypothetical protein